MITCEKCGDKRYITPEWAQYSTIPAPVRLPCDVCCAEPPKCPDCGGSGFLGGIGDPNVPCPACQSGDGTGFMEPDCRLCGGGGVEVVEPTAAGIPYAAPYSRPCPCKEGKASG